MEIRPIEEADVEEVAALWTTVFAYSAPHNAPAAVIRHKLAVQRDLFLVAVCDGALVGTAIGGYDGHRQVLASKAGTVEFFRKLGYSVEERVSMGKLLAPPPTD